MTRNKKGLGDELYSGAATFGRIEAVIGAIAGTIVAIILITTGIVLVSAKTKLTDTVVGTITNVPKCAGYENNEYKCDLEIAYTIDDVPHNTMLTTVDSDTTRYKQGEHIKLYYDPKNPNNAKLSDDNMHIPGWVMIAFGVLVLVTVWVWLYITSKSKFAAAAGGTAAAAGLVRNTISI